MAKVLTYKDYLEQGNRISKDKLTPLTAKPKYSKGDTHKSRGLGMFPKNDYYVSTYKVAKKRGRLVIEED